MGASTASVQIGRVVALVLALAAPAAASELADDAPFKSCRACHEIGPEARHGIGPHLDGLIGRVAGSAEGYRYSEAMRALGRNGLVWNTETLDAFLIKPMAFAPGARMSFRGMSDPVERARLVAWLTQATAAAPAAHATASPAPRAEIGAAALALTGDPAFGEYLANECVTCHQISGRMEGIPSIIGWPRDAFVSALYIYKTNVRAHEVMRSVTSRLGEEEMAALAAYFGSLNPP